MPIRRPVFNSSVRTVAAWSRAADTDPATWTVTVVVLVNGTGRPGNAGAAFTAPTLMPATSWTAHTPPRRSTWTGVSRSLTSLVG